ncbi:DUF6492 family protein [Aeromicrobium duanguangcaii]|uniref:DUF6492 family protein n=1 Tax=Aeromicrobium duanguangcaii TaxID=2968086 RepID=A0ABY5KJ07_9ACTN|nr:DUF6492 family protein [Aeromicrobium duanguangcaii]MCD9153795.1 DUF6492 family protein [Aeromicrobium duanguangcaii]UUI69127.1 DUF6492 family protein [Aeromicrobium duanguangcaii]
MAAAGATLSMVTVFFEAEIGLLKLQARSLVRYHAPGEFERIVVIDNTHRGVSRRTQERLLRQFGPWRDRVRFVRPQDLTDLPTLPGWVGQQVLKLIVHREIDTSHFLVLDAKNHWIQPTDRSTFLAEDGRARGASHTYRGHALEQRVADVLRYVGVDPQEWLDHFMVTHTPVVVSRDVCADLVSDVERRSGLPFAQEFARAGLLEFPLYAGWIIARDGSLDAEIDGSTVRSTTIWPSRTPRGIAEDLAALDHLDSPFLGIHRKALAKATLTSSRSFARLWAVRGLWSSTTAGLWFIVRFKGAYLRTMTVRRVRTRLAARRRTAVTAPTGRARSGDPS